MFGSDYPGLPYERILREWRELGYKDAVMEKIMHGNAERAFCAGADLDEYVDASPSGIIARQMDRLWGAISGCRKPVIAAVRGHALGGGCELAMLADIVVAGDGARIGQD